MKLTPIHTFLATLSILGTLFIPDQVIAGTFEHQEVNQRDFVAIARPFGNGDYDLLILQQIPGQRQCWREQGSSPIFVDPLLLNFDFTGSCQRSTDSNGYSVRIDGKDYGLDYLLRVVERNGELVLIATHRRNYRQPEIVIGRTQGSGQGFLKIQLDPGWRFTKRSYLGKVLGHVYLTGDSSAINSPQPSREGVATTTSNPSEKPVREFTFTSSPSSVNSNPPPTSNARVSPRPFREDNRPKKPLKPPVNYSDPNPSSPSALPPPPSPRSSSSPSASSDFSDLPPLPAPSQVNQSSIVPPPDSSGRQSLSQVIGRLSTPQGSERQTISDGYRVLVSATNSQQKAQVKGLYPDAFPTVYQGRSLWQIGRFSTRINAETALRSFENRGMNGLIIP